MKDKRNEELCLEVQRLTLELRLKESGKLLLIHSYGYSCYYYCCYILHTNNLYMCVCKDTLLHTCIAYT